VWSNWGGIALSKKKGRKNLLGRSEIMNGLKNGEGHMSAKKGSGMQQGGKTREKVMLGD